MRTGNNIGFKGVTDSSLTLGMTLNFRCFGEGKPGCFVAIFLHELNFIQNTPASPPPPSPIQLSSRAPARDLIVLNIN